MACRRAGGPPGPAARAAAPGRDWYWTAPSGRWPRRPRGSWPRAIAPPPRPGPGRSPPRWRGSLRTSRRGRRRRGTRCRAWGHSPPAGRRAAQRLPRPPPAARGESPRRHASEQMLDDRSGDVARRRFLQAAPSGDPVDLDYVRRALTRGQEIDAGVASAASLTGGRHRLVGMLAHDRLGHREPGVREQRRGPELVHGALDRAGRVDHRDAALLERVQRVHPDDDLLERSRGDDAREHGTARRKVLPRAGERWPRPAEP